MIPYQRLRDMMEELYQHPISTGTLVNMVKRGREALEPNNERKKYYPTHIVGRFLLIHGASPFLR
jgi:hypothetical protein